MSKITQNLDKSSSIVGETIPKDADPGLDVNLIIASFQEKLSQLMTELVVKEATIKQLLTTIEKMRGQAQ